MFAQHIQTNPFDKADNEFIIYILIKTYKYKGWVCLSVTLLFPTSYTKFHVREEHMDTNEPRD